MHCSRILILAHLAQPLGLELFHEAVGAGLEGVVLSLGLDAQALHLVLHFGPLRKHRGGARRSIFHGAPPIL